MKTLLKMAWLNLWRNHRRTTLLICAMTAGLAGVLFCAGLINGWLEEMVRSSVRTFEGHVKFMGRDFNRNPVIEHSMPRSPALLRRLAGDDRVAAWTERIAVSALLSTATDSHVVTVMGVDPDRESDVSHLDRAVGKGTFLRGTTSNPILIGRPLAERLDKEVGDKVVLMAQQWGGDLGSGAYRITGIFDTGVASFDQHHVYLLRGDAEALLNMTDRVTEVVVMLQDIEQSRSFAGDYRAVNDPHEVEVLTWKERLPLVARYLELSGRFLLPYYAVFYLAMAFGIVNAISMAVGERTYEIGVMLAMGMRRGRIVFLILLESFFISVIAAFCGTLVGTGTVGLLGRHGIDLTRFAAAMEHFGLGRIIYPFIEPSGIVLAVVTMFITALISTTIPAFRASRMVPVDALRTAG